MREKSTRGVAVDFGRAPILLSWETTKACRLSCPHCRAEAIPAPLPGQLSTEESLRLIEDARSFTPRPPARSGRRGSRCGVCPFADICGGSRARAYAASGDPLGEDPACAYAPVLVPHGR